jgi:exosome complex exonuclease DIS3/RRP44
MNRRHRAAQLAGRASVQLHTLIFFAGEGAKEEDAYILDVETAEQSDPSFRVIVPRYGIEGRVNLPIESDDPKLVRLPKENKLIYDQDGINVSLQVFDKVRVSILVRNVEDHQRELVIELVDPSFPSALGKRKTEDTDAAGLTKKKKIRS